MLSRKDARMGVISEILQVQSDAVHCNSYSTFKMLVCVTQSIRIVKLFAWEEHCKERIAVTRENEVGHDCVS